MTAKRRLSYAQSIRQLSIRWRRLRTTGDENPQFVEKLFLCLTFVIRQEPFQRSGNQCLGPTAIEKPIFIVHAAVGLENRLCLLRLFFMQRQKNLCTAALKRPLSVGSVCEKVFQRGEQK